MLTKMKKNVKNSQILNPKSTNGKKVVWTQNSPLIPFMVSENAFYGQRRTTDARAKVLALLTQSNTDKS